MLSAYVVGKWEIVFENVVFLADEFFTRYIVLLSSPFNSLLLALLTLTLGLTSLMVEAERLALWLRFYRPAYLCFWSHLCSDRHGECKIKSAV